MYSEPSSSSALAFHYQEKNCLVAIEDRLEAFFVRMETENRKWNVAMSRYHFSTGGKRLRALIPCWIFSCYGRDPVEALPLGCAIELLHNATLVHDDLQDGDVLRRGQATVWKKYQKAQAINCGDALFFFALEMLEELPVTPIIWRKLTRRLGRGILSVIEGQAQEFLMKDEMFPGWDRYLEVVSGKTAALFATSIVAALEALNESQATLDWAEQTAMRSGILFQIQDDLLDLYGDKQRERRGSDIAEGKISALVAAFNEQADADDRATLAKVLTSGRDAVSETNIREVMDLFDAEGIKDLLLSRLDELRQIPPPPENCLAGPALVEFFTEINDRFLLPIRGLYPAPVV